jgi:Exocyst complex component Sec5
MYETLIALVSVHAQVCNVAEQLLDRTLNAIVEEVATEALQCFRQVKRFGMGGMLRVRLPFSLSSVIFPIAVCRLHWKLNLCTRLSVDT